MTSSRLGPTPAALLILLPAMAGAGALTASLPWVENDVGGVVIFASTALLLMFWAGRGEGGDGRQTGRWILFMAFVLRGFAAIALRLHALSSLYTADAGMYDQDAWAIAQAWLAEADAGVRAMSFNVTAYEWFAAGVYLVIGRSVLTVQILASLAGALAVYYAWRVARELIGEERGAVIGLLVAVWPSHVLWSSQSIRDPWVFFFMSRAMWAAILWLRHSRPLEWLKALCFTGLVGLFRLSTAGLLAAALLLMAAYTAWRAIGWQGRLLLFGLATGGMLFAWWVAADVDAAGLVPMLSPAGLSRLRRALATGGSAFFPELAYDSWIDVAHFVPVGIVYVLFAPFPWDVGNTAQFVSVLENSLLCILLAMGLLIPRRLMILAQRPGAFTGLVVVVGLSALAVVEGNVGTAYRHKVQFVPYLLMLIGPGWPVGGDIAERRAAESVA